MRILFVSTNRLKRIMPPMPLGLASVIAQIDELRHEIQVLDLMFAEQPEVELKARLAGFSPDLVALSIRNVDNQSCYQTEYLLPEDKKVVEWCREASEATVVVGGTAFTVSPVAIFEYLEADFGIAGEGEVAFRELSRIRRTSRAWCGAVRTGSARIRPNTSRTWTPCACRAGSSSTTSATRMRGASATSSLT